MRRPMTLSPLVVCLALVTAGCAAPPPAEGPGQGEDPEDRAEITFDGASQPTTHSETARCDEDGGLTAGGNIDRGLLRLRVVDGAGAIVHTENVSGDVDLEVDGIQGAPGVWTLESHQVVNATAGEFRGTYSVVLVC